MNVFLTRLCLVVSLLLSYTNSKSQGIRLDGICYSGINDRYSSAGFWGIGYDHNLGEKLSVGLTYRTPFSSNEGLYINEVRYGYPTNDGDVYFTVYHINDWQEFAYTSKYYFIDNEDAGFYVASGISLMLATNTYKVDNLTTVGNTQPYQGDVVPGDYEQEITLIPFSLDLGHRGEFDGLFFEYFVGMQILPFGANPDVEPAFLANHGVETRYMPVSFHAGISLGYSWIK